MPHNRLLQRRRHHQLMMDNHVVTRHVNKFWFVLFVFFLFWYLLLYGHDWSSLPGLSSVSPSQENSPPKSDDAPREENSLQSALDNHKNEEIIFNPKSPHENNQEVSLLSATDENNKENSLRSATDENNQENSLQSAADENNKENPTSNSDDTVRNDDKNVTIVSGMSNDQSNNISRNDDKEHEEEESIDVNDDSVEDLPGLEKELESTLPKDREEQEDDNVVAKRCSGRYIYVHELPSRFNDDYLKQCKLLNKWQDMCQSFVNDGLGPSLGNPQRLFTRSCWYATHQFALEIIFHNRMKQYECITSDSSKAAAIFVPYYPGLDVARYLWDHYNSSIKDADSKELFKMLRQKPEWKLMGGKDHFLVSGRITWDFRRPDESSEWGNNLMMLPESQNMTMLAIESSPWHKNDFAIPYPTYFHPRTNDEVLEWQNKMRRQKRRSLFCFAGAPRPNMDNSIRSEIMAQCTASSRKCRMMECKDDKHNCLKPAYVMKMFQNSVFCLQPPGDSFTRRSTFDSILAGCIPVFFSPGSAYVQYLWHLPKDYRSYSVLIPEGDVKRKKVNIDNVLSKIPRSKILAMREKVIRLIPNVIYADPRSRFKTLIIDDAFDLTVRGVIQRVDLLRKETREGRNYSDEFDSESSWKYYTFGTTRKHEWDHYFKRHR